MKFCTRFLYAITNTSPACVYYFCLSDFSSVKVFFGNVAHLRPNCFSEKKKNGTLPGVRPRDGHVEHVSKISRSI